MVTGFDDVPCNRFFGFVLKARSADRVELELPLRAEFVQEEGVVQGGVLTALADTAAVYLLWPDLPAGRGMTGTGCAMQFLAAAWPDRGPLLAIARPLRKGRTMAVCESELFQGDRMIAKGTFPFLFLDRQTS
ncbi:MAG: PaaI family thioesterase [Planctomycetes bacterium]|nr:PaaI family thioesterase [Planctomycetota bacterium]